MTRGLEQVACWRQYLAREETSPRHHTAARHGVLEDPTRTLQHPLGDSTMTWQTPRATDFRFGFEITMYVAAR